MKPKRTSAASADAAAVAARFVIVTLDAHLAAAVTRARALLARALPGLELAVHVGAEWGNDPAAAERCRRDLAAADFIVVTQMFVDEQIAEILPTLRARRDACDALVGVMSAPEVMRLTRMGGFEMGGEEPGAWSPAALLRRMLGGRRDAAPAAGSGERQVRAMRRVPQLLRFIPGTAQDVRAYYQVMQYWTAGTDENVASLVRHVVSRYANGPRAALGRAARPVPEPVSYPEVGVYHPSLPTLGMADDAAALPRRGAAGTVGLLLMRSYLLARNTAHYDAVIAALEARGLRVIPAFAFGLDGRPAIDRFFRDAAGDTRIDALVSLTGFSLVGGPAYNDAAAAQAALASLDVPYLSLQTLEFQSVGEWQDDVRGLNPLQAALQVAIPELDGATGPLVFGGRDDGAAGAAAGASVPVAERVERLAGRVARLVALRRAERAERRVAVVLFNFPPNAGNTGTAAYLAVFDSLHRTLAAMARAGYSVEVPASVDELRDRLLVGNAARYGALANVGATVSAEDHVRREPHLDEIERAWGAAPGRQQSFGGDILVLGARFGNVFVGVQPAFGYEGDPMRLLFERGFAPTHAFSAFYRYLAEDFGAHAVLHFGTHGALEFMPGKQVGLTARCWPDRLIGDLPNVYLYASNNPSEGALAKRRGSATLVSYLTPPVTNAGLYRGLLELRETLDRLGGLAPDAGVAAMHELLGDVQRQAALLGLAPAAPEWNGDGLARAAEVRARLLELEYTLIPAGLHTVGVPPDAAERAGTLAAIARCASAELDLPSLDDLLAGAGGAADARELAHRCVAELVATGSPAQAAAVAGAAADGPVARWLEHLASLDARLREDHELPGILRALDGRYVPPAPGGDVLRNAAVLPTGRNVYGFDPYRVPGAHAVREGRAQSDRLLRRHAADHGALPETVAVVLWGTDNMKSQGAPLAQVLALLGAEPRFDGLGRLAGARLLPLEELGRPRVDVVVTLSGIFRDLFPLQVRLIAEAALLAAEADEPLELNPVRRHALANQAALGCDLETAALRVFSNAEGAYGANVNLLVDSGRWTSDDALAETFQRRKGFAYGRKSSGVAAPELFGRMLGLADLAYQNIDAVESGATDIDQYVDSLGGLSRAVGRARGADAPVYFSDNTGPAAAVRTAAEQIALESHTRLLNPKWYEAVLRSGHEGARTIAAQVTHTLGWSATTGAVPDWVYREACATFVLDAAMRDRLAALNGDAAVRLSERLLEAHDRGYWAPSEEMLAALRDANAELEDRLEGVDAGTASLVTSGAERSS